MRLFAGEALLASSLLLLSVAVVVGADARSDLAARTGLDADLVGVLQLDVGGGELSIALVFLDARALDSRISPALRATLQPYLGRHALYVNPNVRGAVAQSAFDPLRISVQVEGTPVMTPPATAWVEITPGFLQGRFVTNPAGASQGSGSEGVLILGDAIDPTRPFAVLYGGARADFEIASPRGATSSPATAALSHVPLTVPPIETTATLADILLHPDATPTSLAALLSLDESLVRVLEPSGRSGGLRIVAIRLEASVRDSALERSLLERVDPLIGTGAVMVWAAAAVGAAFSPWTFYIHQGGTNYVFFSSASFVELTSGFLRVESLAAGNVAAGVIRLPKGVDAGEAFALAYQTARAWYP